MKWIKDNIPLLVVFLLVILADIVYFYWVGSLLNKKETTSTAQEPLVVIRYATKEEEKQLDMETINALSQTVWGEARGCSTTEQAAVIWCILNRVDSPDFPNDPLMVVQQPNQFAGYDPSYPIEQEFVDLVNDVMGRWELEKTAVGSVGRVLPKEYTYFHGDGVRNWFRDAYKGGNTWNWSLDSPYEEDCGNV